MSTFDEWVQPIEEHWDWMPAYFAEASRQAREMPTSWSGRQWCCGATNAHCSTPPRDVFMINTGCERCGHALGCHTWGY